MSDHVTCLLAKQQERPFDFNQNKHTHCFRFSSAQWIPVNMETSEASLKGVNKKYLISAAGEKRFRNLSGNIWAGNGRISMGATGWTHSEEVQVRPEEVAWTLPYDPRYCVVMTFKVEHQSHRNHACQSAHTSGGLLRNDIKLEIFGHGHLSV